MIKEEIRMCLTREREIERTIHNINLAEYIIRIIQNEYNTKEKQERKS